MRTITARIVSFSLLHPFATSKDSEIRTVTNTVDVALIDGCGQTFHSDSIPVQYVTGETPESVCTAISQASTELQLVCDEDFEQAALSIAKILPNSPSARAGVESVFLRAISHRKGHALPSFFGSGKGSLLTDITIPLTGDFRDRVRDASTNGFTSIKIKIGSGDPQSDFERIVEIMDLAPNLALRIDANQGFDTRGAIDFAEKCFATGTNIEIFEQPVDRTDLTGLDAVARNCPYLVMADEAIRSSDDAKRLIDTTAVGGSTSKL